MKPSYYHINSLNINEDLQFSAMAMIWFVPGPRLSVADPILTICPNDPNVLHIKLKCRPGAKVTTSRLQRVVLSHSLAYSLPG